MSKTYLMICGPGESGKDVFASILKQRLPSLAYKYPTSYYCIEPFFKEIEEGLWTTEKLNEAGYSTERLRNEGDYDTEVIGYYPGQFTDKMEFYASRRTFRWIWGHWVNVYNCSSPDKIRLYRDAIEAGEQLFVGLRKIDEYDSFRRHFSTFSIWIQRDGVKYDPTQEYGADKCDFIVQNNGTIEELRKKVNSMLNFFNSEFLKDCRVNIDKMLNSIKC